MRHSALNIVLTTLTLTTSFVSTCQNCCKCIDTLVPEVLPEVANKVILSSSYATVMASSLSRCAVRCMRQRKCRSFNYDVGGRACYLNDKSHFSHPEMMFTRPTDVWNYYVVEQWDQSFLGGCSNHGCGLETVCEERGGESAKRFTCSPEYSADMACRQTSCAECQPDREYNSRTFNAVGCYSSLNARVLPNFLGSFRASTIVWDDLSSFEAVLQQCSVAASGYDLFGVEFFGECYAANYSEVTFHDEVDVTECHSKCLYGGVGVGHNDVMFVYRWST